MFVIPLHLSFWAWLSQLSNNRCVFNILGFSGASSYSDPLIDLCLSVDRKVVSCVGMFRCKSLSGSVKTFPLRLVRRSKLQYLVHFSDRVKVMKSAE
jgi:hypothetical protein